MNDPSHHPTIHGRVLTIKRTFGHGRVTAFNPKNRFEKLKTAHFRAPQAQTSLFDQ